MITKTISKKTSNNPTAGHCREKYYSLKRGYRNFGLDSQQTGNKRPKPYLFENEMPFLLENYLAFKPLVIKSSLGSHEINNNVSEKSDRDDKWKRGMKEVVVVPPDHPPLVCAKSQNPRRGK